MYGAYWAGMVLPNPLTSYANIAGVIGVEHVRYEGRLGVKRRRWTTGEIIADAYGHVCRLYARIRCCIVTDGIRILCQLAHFVERGGRSPRQEGVVLGKRHCTPSSLPTHHSKKNEGPAVNLGRSR